jgi:hypothetical protein
MCAFLLDDYAAGQTDALGIPLLRGDALDVNWSNIVADPETGVWQSTGAEWSFGGLLPLDFVLWRGLCRVLTRHRRLLAGAGTDSPEEYALSLVSRLFPTAAAGRSALYEELERFVQRAEGGDPAGHDTLEPGPRVEALVALAEAPRSFQVLAFAKELVERPELLSTYAAAFGAGDSVRLIAYAPDADVNTIASQLEAAITETSCDPDVVLLAVSREAASELRLADSTQALLSGQAAAEPFAAMPRFSVGEGEGLRVLAFSA